MSKGKTTAKDILSAPVVTSGGHKGWWTKIDDWILDEIDVIKKAYLEGKTEHSASALARKIKEAFKELQKVSDRRISEYICGRLNRG